MDDFSLTIEPGEFVSVLGASGSGKSTLLRTVAGLESPTSGEISIGGVSATTLPPERRDIGMVFQDYALFPHLSVLDNVRYPLRMRRVPRTRARARAEETLDLVGLGGLGSRKPHQLSGGQQQRVALARALSFEPALLLLDEPLSALDKNLREAMKIELQALHRRLGVTVLFVTHDQGEALALSDRTVIMRDGRIEAVGRPETLYSRPPTEYAATFLGEATFLEGRALSVDSHGLTVALSNKEFRVTADQVNRPLTELSHGMTCRVAVRPEAFTIQPGDDWPSIAVEIAQKVYSGAVTRVIMRTAACDDPVEATFTAGEAHRVGDVGSRTRVYVDPRMVMVFA